MAVVSLEKLPSNECYWPLLMISQLLVDAMAWCHQKTITWANVDPVLCRHMASLGPKELSTISVTASVKENDGWVVYKELLCLTLHGPMDILSTIGFSSSIPFFIWLELACASTCSRDIIKYFLSFRILLVPLGYSHWHTYKINTSAITKFTDDWIKICT